MSHLLLQYSGTMCCLKHVWGIVKMACYVYVHLKQLAVIEFLMAEESLNELTFASS